MFLVIYVGYDAHKEIGIYRVRKQEPQAKPADDIFVEIKAFPDYPSRSEFGEQSHHLLARCRRCRHFDCDHAITVQRRLATR